MPRLPARTAGVHRPPVLSEREKENRGWTRWRRRLVMLLRWFVLRPLRLARELFAQQPRRPVDDGGLLQHLADRRK